MEKARIERLDNKDVNPPARILTFSMDHSPVKIQTLSSHTIFDLIRCICKETTVGMDETVDCHYNEEYSSSAGFSSPQQVTQRRRIKVATEITTKNVRYRRYLENMGCLDAKFAAWAKKEEEKICAQIVNGEITPETKTTFYLDNASKYVQTAQEIRRRFIAERDLWHLSIPGKGKYTNCRDPFYDEALLAREKRLGDLDLVPNTNMTFTYDQIEYNITFATYTEIADSENGAHIDFPRRKPEPGPIRYSKFVPSNAGIDINTMFSNLSKWAFVEGKCVELNLFQAGDKPHHGFQQRGPLNWEMMYTPVKVGSDLSHYLHCLDHAASVSNPNKDYDWYSLIALSESNATNEVITKYGQTSPGFYKMSVAPTPALGVALLNMVFPKVAALAGYAEDESVPKGWIKYKNKSLMVCSGEAKPCKSTCQSTAFAGINQYNPSSSDDVLLQKNVEIDSLHDLICVVEGLLETL